MEKKFWAILDGDDTLWFTAILYDQARNAIYQEALASKGIDFDGFSNACKHNDIELAKIIGYAKHRFPTSLKATVYQFLGENAHVEACRAEELAYDIYNKCCVVKDGAVELVKTLKDEGWNIVLITAGEPSVQEKRVMDFPAHHLFDHVEILIKKTTETLSSVVDRFAIDPEQAMVLGDSLRSDILPAHALGIQGILLAANNWKDWEVLGHDHPEKTHAALNLSSALEMFQSFKAGFKNNGLDINNL